MVKNMTPNCCSFSLLSIFIPFFCEISSVNFKFYHIVECFIIEISNWRMGNYPLEFEKIILFYITSFIIMQLSAILSSWLTKSFPINFWSTSSFGFSISFKTKISACDWSNDSFWISISWDIYYMIRTIFPKDSILFKPFSLNNDLMLNWSIRKMIFFIQNIYLLHKVWTIRLSLSKNQ